VGYRGLEIAIPEATSLKRYFPQENTRLDIGGKDAQIVEPL
jgi:hypothetical protein